MMSRFPIRKSLITFAIWMFEFRHVIGFVCSTSQRVCISNLLMADPLKEVETKSSTVAPSFEDPDMKAYASAYTTVFEELKCKSCQPSEGEIPDDLIGSYFRSGPAMFSAGSIKPPRMSIVQPKKDPVPDGEDPERMVRHPFEGDGAVLGVTFSGTGKATARFRFVRTAGFTSERKKGKRIYKGMDSTRELGSSAAAGLGNDMHLPFYRHHLQPGLNKNRKNTSNTRAIFWGKKLLTLWEGGLPYKLDALALSTDGRSQLGGILREEEPFGCKLVYDSKNNRSLFYASMQNLIGTTVIVYEFDEKFKRKGIVEYEMPGLAMISDFCGTENYAVFVQPEVAASKMKYLFTQDPGKVVQLEKGSSLLHIVARFGRSRESKSFAIPFDGTADGELQFCNAYEDGAEITFDAIRSDGSKVGDSDLPTWPWADKKEVYERISARKSLWRYTVDIKTGSVSKKLLHNDQCSFGVINPAFSAQKHRYIYANVGSRGSDVSPPQGIMKFDCETQETDVWMPESYEFCGEPMYAPSSKEDLDQIVEDSGYILSVLYNGKRKESEMVILNASDVAAGPIGRVPLGISIPHGLFGCFAPTEEAAWDEEAIDRRSKLSDKIESRGNMWNEVKSDFSGLSLRLDDIEEIFPDLL